MGRFNRGRVVWSRRGCSYPRHRYLMTIGRGGGKSEGGVVCLFEEESCGCCVWVFLELIWVGALNENEVGGSVGCGSEFDAGLYFMVFGID